MLSGSKLGQAFASGKLKLILALCLAGSIPATTVYSYQVQQIDNLSSQLADRTNTIADQEQQIRQYASIVDSQREELGTQVAQLETLTRQVAMLEAEVADKTAETTILTTTIEKQRIQLQSLQSQALQLQNEINTLRQELAQNEAEITDLTRQVQKTQTQLDSTRRITVSHYGLGVTEAGEGVAFPIEVEIIGSGDGTISVDVKNVQYEASFQEAVRVAATVASEYTDTSVSDKDIIIRFVNDQNGLIRVDGGSAGALITGMIAAGLDDRPINPSVLITGTIRSDGTVGRIGGLESKTNAAAEFGAETMLVPEEQEFWHDSIRVVGVSDIDEVMRYLALR